MDRKAGYKECSRCGLRNKPSALQCDFCGLRFIAGEDWDDNIQALEKMGGNEERVLVDEDVSKRIEATIVKRDKFNPPVKAKESRNDDFDYFRKDPEPVRVLTGQPSAVGRGPASYESEKQPAGTEQASSGDPQAAERIVLQERPVAAAPTEPVKERTVVRRVRTKSNPAVTPASTSARPGTFAAVLILGVVWYLVAILFGDQALGRIGSWALITVSTLMVVVGAGGVFKSRSKDVPPGDGNVPDGAPTKQVLMCPKCHELVKATDRTCPDCGTEFGSN
jgi:RNA polymerase subunit RPABC4/transcription elongation factor Spt4